MNRKTLYGDVLRQALTDAGISLQRVSAKAVKDHSETFDCVPSQHDGKDAAVIAELCSLGKGASVMAHGPLRCGQSVEQVRSSSPILSAHFGSPSLPAPCPRRTFPPPMAPPRPCLERNPSLPPAAGPTNAPANAPPPATLNARPRRLHSRARHLGLY